MTSSGFGSIMVNKSLGMKKLDIEKMLVRGYMMSIAEDASMSARCSCGRQGNGVET